MINEFRYGQTWKIWPPPLSLSLYSTFKYIQIEYVIERILHNSLVVEDLVWHPGHLIFFKYGSPVNYAF